MAPLTESSSIDSLCDVLQINRPLTHPSDMVSPHDDITGNDITASVANYTVAIRLGLLIVEIEDGDFCLHLDRSSIER